MPQVFGVRIIMLVDWGLDWLSSLFLLGGCRPRFWRLGRSDAVVCCDLEWAWGTLAIDMHDVAGLLRMLPSPQCSPLLALWAWHDAPAVMPKVSCRTETLVARPRESGPGQETTRRHKLRRSCCPRDPAGVSGATAWRDRRRGRPAGIAELLQPAQVVTDLPPLPAIPPPAYSASPLPPPSSHVSPRPRRGVPAREKRPNPEGTRGVPRSSRQRKMAPIASGYTLAHGSLRRSYTLARQ